MGRKNICKRLVVAAVGLCLGVAATASAAEDPSIPDALAVIHSRKSVRHFTGQPVSADLLNRIVRAGMAAPTAVNMQPWSFVVVTDRAMLDALAAGLPYAKMLDKAGAAIVVCALPDKAFQKKTEFAIIDASCASENILLAIEALGLGGVWTAAYPDPERMDLVRKVLGVPAEVIPLNVIPVGHPDGTDQPKDKFHPENIHLEKW
ncbi:MAG: nitroreductase family protein [Candidatus Omnitrophica bacterium]|nr:nitroreductase family protein [Candidatus Omnitrophota bacterium]